LAAVQLVWPLAPAANNGEICLEEELKLDTVSTSNT